MDIAGFAAGPYKTNTYVAINGGEAFVVDPGMHTHDRTVEYLQQENATLQAVLLTHGHLDHTRDAGSLATQFNVPVYIHPDDEFMLSGGEGVSDHTKLLFDAANMTPIRELRYFEDNTTITIAGISLEVKHAPGHSPGSVLLIDERFVFSGDVLFRGTIGRTDLQHSDPKAMDRSLAGPVWSLDDDLAVLPGHGPTTSMRMERTSNPYLRMAHDNR